MSLKEFPSDPNKQIQFVQNERKNVIQSLANASKKSNKLPDAATEPGRSLLARLDALLAGLSEKVKMTPQMKERTKLEEALKIIFEDNIFHFAPDHVDKARLLYAKWESENWGCARPVPQPTREQRRHSNPSPLERSSSGQTRVRYPPPDHPIWGENGIMHGIAIKTNSDTGRKSKVLNDQYDKRDARKFGHNGIDIGTWYPSQLSALFHGAHGSSQGGISGDPNTGAYSVVISGGYEVLDHDGGDTLYYSGSGSHDNENSHRAAESTSGTRALGTSMANGKPVRVLRASSGKGRWAPYQGIRYDGLYHVVNKRYPRNEKGGMYEQFELEREQGQISLEACRARPNAKDLKDWERIGRGY